MTSLGNAACFKTDDPPLFPPRDDRALVAGDALSHLVRDRGRGGRGDGRDRPHSEGGGEGDPKQGRQGQVRRRADRRDRKDDQARRHRLPHPPRRIHRAGRAVRAPGHDQLRRARHLPRRAAQAGERHSDRRRRRAARGAQAPRLRAQAHPDHRPLAWRPRRADHLRPQARFGLCRVLARPGAAGRGAGGDFDRGDLRRRRHLRQHRPEGRSPCGGEARPESGADLDPGDPARPACGLFRRARRRRFLGRAARDRDPPPAAHRSDGGRGSSSPRARRARPRCPTSAIRS